MPEAPPVAPPARTGPVLPAVTAIGAALAGLAAATLSVHRFFQVDEYVFVRCAWLVGGGAVPYRDFFDHHTPLFYTLLAPVVASAPENGAALLAARIFALLLLAVAAALTWKLARRTGSRGGAWLALFLLLTCHAFVARAIEVRADLLATVCFLGVAAVLTREGAGGRGRGALAGILTAAALLSTQKTAYLLWGVALLAGLDLLARLRSPRRQPLLGASPAAFFAGLLLTAAAALAGLALCGALPAFWEQNVALALEWQATQRRFPALPLLLPALAGSPHWMLGVLGGAAVPAFQRHLRPLLSPRQWVVYGALAGPALLSLALNPIPWPYNFMPVIAIMTPLAAFLVPWLERLGGRGVRTLVWAALLVVATAAYAARLRIELARDNHGQLRDLATVLAVTAPDRPVFDSNGAYLFRPAAYRYWYHSSAMRALLQDRFAAEIEPSILATGAPAAIVDFRLRELPIEVRDFVEQHYRRHSGALHLWGRAFHAPAGEPMSALFLAVRDGDYFLQTAGDAITPPRVRVGGRLVEPRHPFRLAAGEHRVEVAAPPAGEPIDIFLLWLPATGDLWRPLPGEPPPYYPYLPTDSGGWNAR